LDASIPITGKGAGNDPTRDTTKNTTTGVEGTTSGNTVSGMKGCRNLGSLSEALAGLLIRRQSPLVGLMA
jgi:hypothetical protein